MKTYALVLDLFGVAVFILRESFYKAQILAVDDERNPFPGLVFEGEVGLTAAQTSCERKEAANTSYYRGQ